MILNQLDFLFTDFLLRENANVELPQIQARESLEFIFMNVIEYYFY